MIAASLLTAIPRPASACGPFFTDAIFVYTKHPDFPLEHFAQGRLGVIQPTYARSYLFVAYRNLTGANLNATEVSSMKSLWDDRLNNAGELDESGWSKTWTDARSKVAGIGAAPQFRAFRNREKPHEYERGHDRLLRRLLNENPEVWWHIDKEAIQFAIWLKRFAEAKSIERGQ